MLFWGLFICIIFYFFIFSFLFKMWLLALHLISVIFMEIPQRGNPPIWFVQSLSSLQLWDLQPKIMKQVGDGIQYVMQSHKTGKK